jgi:hypothetical protein
MEIPKEQYKLNIKRFSNKKQTQGQDKYFYEVRSYRNEYVGDIEFLKINNQWYLHSRVGVFLSATEIDEISNFINNLPKNKSIYEKNKT